VTKRALDVPKNSFDQSQMLIARVVHVKTNLLHGVGDVRTSECQVLKSTCQAAVGRGIGDRTDGFVAWKTKIFYRKNEQNPDLF